MYLGNFSAAEEDNIDGLVQNCSNSSAVAQELLLTH